MHAFHRLSLVHGRVADGVDFVPVGGEGGGVHILDDGRIFLFLREIRFRQADSGAGQVGRRGGPVHRRLGDGVPADGIDRKERVSRGFLQ